MQVRVKATHDDVAWPWKVRFVTAVLDKWFSSQYLEILWR